VDSEFVPEPYNRIIIGVGMGDMHVDSVIKTFGTRQVLTDIFLTCSQGEIIGMLGRNGTGKSTLLKIIFGSLLPDQKYIMIGNKSIKGIYDIRNLLNYLPQHHFLPNHVKVSMIISLFCDKENSSLLKGNDLVKPMLGKKSKQLSGGEKRLLEILLILHSNAGYLLIDEPFNGLDPIYRDYVKNLIREQSKSKCLIITDHDYRNILDVSTRVVLLHDGGMKEISDTNKLKELGYIPETVINL
jgi:ABC-type multidrug transport system ATPase subunit